MLHGLIARVAGWSLRHQQRVITDPQEEDIVFKTYLDGR
jgi:hypothetical protein